MKKKLTFLILFILLLPCCAFASKKVLVVQGSEGLVYRRAYSSFMSSLPAEIAAASKTIVVSRNTRRIVSRYKPDVIIAIGDNSLKQLLSIRKIPVGFLLCSNIKNVSGRSNFFGITSDYDYCTVKNKVSTVMPSVKNIIFLYRAGRALPPADCEPQVSLIPLNVESSSELASVINQNAHIVDAVVIDPGSDLLTRETREYLFQFSLENQVPLISLGRNKKFSKSAFLFDPAPDRMGSALALMTAKYLNNLSDGLRQEKNSWLSVFINKRAVRMLKLDVREESKRD